MIPTLPSSVPLTINHKVSSCFHLPILALYADFLQSLKPFPATSKKPNTFRGQLFAFCKQQWFLVCSYVLELSARRTTPYYEELGGLECVADATTKVMLAEQPGHGVEVSRSPLWNRKSLVCSSISVIRWISWCKAISKMVKYWIKCFYIPMVNRYLATLHLVIVIQL